MGKRTININPVISGRDMPESSTGSPPRAPLKKQDPHSRDPWQPGEVPAFPYMKTLRPLSVRATPYGHGSIGVERPQTRGSSYPLRPEIETTEIGNKGIK